MSDRNEEDRRLWALTQEGMLRLGSPMRLQNESTADFLRRQRDTILAARTADEKAKLDAIEAEQMRKEIIALGHKPAA